MWQRSRFSKPFDDFRTKPPGRVHFDWAIRISLSNLRPLLSLFPEDLAIDLGTVNTRVYARDRGIVINEPSAVALDNRMGDVLAVGKEAKEMLVAARRAISKL